MNPPSVSSVNGFLTCVLVFAIAHCAAAGPATAPAMQTALDPIAQLTPGKTAGTYHLAYHARAELTLPGHCPLMISISEPYHDIATLRLDDAGEFTAEADLRPGTYSVVVYPANPDAGYWSSRWQSIHIDKAGHLYQPFQWWGQTAGVFVLRRDIKDMSPTNLAIADAKQPLLKWPAIPGATHYRGDYSTADRGKEFIIDETQYLIVGGVNAGERCRWEIDALDDHGKVLAHGARMFLGFGTDQAAIAQIRSAARGTCGVPPPPGRSYLGVSPRATQVPKDPAVPAELPTSDGRSMSGPANEDESSGFIPGIEIHEVLSGSPAVDADLHPDDVIIALDGQRVPTMMGINQGDAIAFSRQISAMDPGRQITLTVRRFPRELTIQATIGRYPGAAATQPAAAPPTTAPAAASDNHAAAALVSHAVWSDVAPGRPTRRPFHAAPGTDIPILSIGDGLHANFANCMAELPHGEIAFGNWDGLSIWDGAEIRTYTRESSRGKRGKPPVENRGLPASMIQDLFCDSHGRLWVGTSAGVCRIDTASTAPPTAPWRVLANPEPDVSSQGGRDHTLDVEKIFEASDGTIVLGGRFSGITLIDPQTETPKLIHSDGEINHWITGIAEDNRHRLWFSVYGVGVLRYDGIKVEQIHGPWIVGNDLCGICVDRAGTVWVAEGDAGLGALHADGITERFDPDQLAGGNIDGVSTDHTGRVWVTCAGGLAVRAPDNSHGKNKPWQFAGPGGDRLWCALTASDGSLWTSGSEISRSGKLQLSDIKPRAAAVARFKRETEKTYPNVKIDRRTAIGAGGIVVAVAGSHLRRFDGKKWDDLTETFGHPDVSMIRGGRNGSVWIATYGKGLIGLDPGGGIRRYSNEPRLMKGYIYDIDEAPGGALYAGTGDGLYRLRDTTWEKIETDQPVYQVGKVLVDRRGRVWLMEDTYDNLFVYDGKRIRDVKDQTILSDEEMEEGSLRLDAAGNVLVDIRGRPAEGMPKRTFRWDASVAGKIGQPVEVK